MAKWILPFLILVGCGNQYDNDNVIVPANQFSTEYDVIGATGLRIKYDPTAEDYPPPLWLIENAYIELMDCLNIRAVGPLIIIMPAVFSEGKSVPAKYTLNSGVISIRTDQAFVTLIHQHEFVHYLLDVSGFPDDANNNHDSELFAKCAY